MKKLERVEIMKSRGYVATIKSAYKMFAGNFRMIFLHIWPYALAYAVVGGATFAHQVRMFSAPNMLDALLGMIVSFVLTAITSVVFYARCSMLINGKGMKNNTVRILKLFLWSCLFSIVFFSIVGAIAGVYAYYLKQDAANEAINFMVSESQSQMIILKIMGIAMLASIILTLFFLPLSYPANKYIAEPESRFHKILAKGYMTGIRHWGYIFLTYLLVGILVTLATLVIWMPNLVLSSAMRASTVGMLQGDPLGMPAYFEVLSYGVSTVSYFAFTFILIFLLIVGYFMYGSIMTKEQEAKEQKI